MPVISDTAYPRLPAEPGAAELEAFTPEAAELAFARQRTRQPGPRLALLVLLKAFQRLGYAVRLADVPTALVTHVATSAGLGDAASGAGAGFRSLTENIDSTTAPGRMMMQMLGAFAEFERAMVRERTQAGLRSARAQGRRGGRQPKLSPPQQAEVLAMLTAGRSAADVARLFRVHRATISRIANHAVVGG